MNKTSQLICIQTAWILASLLGGGWFFVTGWFPPISPSLDANTIQTMYSENRLAIRIGITLSCFSSVFWWTFSAAISSQLKRMEGVDPIWSRVQMAAASGTVMVVLFACYFILTAAYRPEMPAENVQIFNDMGWLMNVGAYPPAFLQNIAIGLCILTNKSDVHPYPRWLGYANLWIALLYLPGAFLPFFHHGPFTWNGILGFWLVASVFFPWILLMWWYTYKAIKNQPDIPITVASS